jgi:hypothetical protein
MHLFFKLVNKLCITSIIRFKKNIKKYIIIDYIMQYKIVQDDSDSILWLIIVVIIFFSLILPKIEKCNAKDNQNMLEKFASLNQKSRYGLSNCDKVDLNMCSPACCGSQWPTGIKITSPYMSASDIKKNFATSNYTCSGTGKGQGPGCVCIPKHEKKFLEDRGNNRKTIKIS